MASKPIKSVKLSAGSRLYYFNIHKDSKGQPYLVITEIPPKSNVAPQHLVIHADHLAEFDYVLYDVIDEVLEMSENVKA